MIRHSPRLIPLLLALCAAGSAAALEHQQAINPMLGGGGTADPGTPYYVGIETAVESKVLDDNRVVQDDAAIGLKGTFRAYGFGLTLDTDWALGQAPDYSRPGKTTNPGELVRTALTLDWALEIRDPRQPKVPLLQLIPHFTMVTYPNQVDVYTTDYDNLLKDKQRWLGLDLWWALPIEGVELGAGIEQNLSTTWRACRGDFGAREFYQTSAIDFSFWQTVGFGDSEYRLAVAGKDKSGFNAVRVGGRATMPFFIKGLDSFFELDISYWLDQKIRDNMRDAGIDGGNVVLSAGLVWTPE